MKKSDAIKFVEILKETYPNATCSLDFKTPFQMVVAVMLSAQCTDERVNKTTPALFERCKTVQDFADIDINELEKIRYENIKLNAQIDTLNKLTDKQSDDIATLKIDLATTKKHLDSFKKQYEDSNNHSFITGIVIGFIPSLLIFILTIIATKYGLL
mgnify:CR=1 FL=1